MTLFRRGLLLALVLLSGPCWSQTPFQASWGFEGNASGSSSSPLVTAAAMQLSNVNVSAVPATAYPAGQVGQAVNITSWTSSGGCNPTEHVDFTVTPASGARITLTSLSFYFARSALGPMQLSVRSSVDGFSADLFATTAVSETFQPASIALTAPGFINQSGPVTFRIYACNPADGRGALKLDEFNLNAFVLPVELLYFRAQVVNDRVELAWATTFERNADRFVVERSRDLREFGALGSVPALGTTDQTQRYVFTDAFPDGGTTYYRLKQVDLDGKYAYSQPVSVTLDDQTPALVVLGNPVEGGVIQVATRNIAGAAFSLITSTGQLIPLTLQTGTDGRGLLVSLRSLPAGFYALRAQKDTWHVVYPLLVR